MFPMLAFIGRVVRAALSCFAGWAAAALILLACDLFFWHGSLEWRLYRFTLAVSAAAAVFFGVPLAALDPRRELCSTAAQAAIAGAALGLIVMGLFWLIFAGAPPAGNSLVFSLVVHGFAVVNASVALVLYYSGSC